MKRPLTTEAWASYEAVHRQKTAERESRIDAGDTVGPIVVHVPNWPLPYQQRGNRYAWYHPTGSVITFCTAAALQGTSMPVRWRIERRLSNAVDVPGADPFTMELILAIGTFVQEEIISKATGAHGVYSGNPVDKAQEYLGYWREGLGKLFS